MAKGVDLNRNAKEDIHKIMKKIMVGQKRKVYQTKQVRKERYKTMKKYENEEEINLEIKLAQIKLHRISEFLKAANIYRIYHDPEVGDYFIYKGDTDDAIEVFDLPTSIDLKSFADIKLKLTYNMLIADNEIHICIMPYSAMRSIQGDENIFGELMQTITRLLNKEDVEVVYGRDPLAEEDDQWIRDRRDR